MSETKQSTGAGKTVPAANPQGGEVKTSNEAKNAKQSTGAGKKVFIVDSVFRDKDDFKKQYEVGDDVSHFDADRLKSLVERGLVKES